MTTPECEAFSISLRNVFSGIPTRARVSRTRCNDSKSLSKARPASYDFVASRARGFARAVFILKGLKRKEPTCLWVFGRKSGWLFFACTSDYSPDAAPFRHQRKRP